MDPAEADRVFATVGCWLDISQAYFAVVGMYVTVNGARTGGSLVQNPQKQAEAVECNQRRRQHWQGEV